MTRDLGWQGATRYLPIFPLGTVLVPTQVLPLRVFEDRYRVLMESLTRPASPGELGVLLIERGSEVGGGDQRVSTGTVAHLIEAEELPDGRWLAVFAGSHRFRVVRWLADDPFPQAEVEEIPDPDWDEGDRPALEQADAAVSQALALASRLGEGSLGPGFALSSDPRRGAWELCGIAPVGSLDRQRLLECSDRRARLELLAEQAEDLAKVLAFRLQGR